MLSLKVKLEYPYTLRMPTDRYTRLDPLMSPSGYSCHSQSVICGVLTINAILIIRVRNKDYNVVIKG